LNQLSDKLIQTIIFDYIPFIILLGSLFTITGGIFLSGDIKARPIINIMFLGAGAILASFIGTTGAAMLLIRPVIQTNKERKFKVHTILFFIGIVANCG
jgi:Na+/H+ antiporter NhaD/arsenite permease-like protein